MKKVITISLLLVFVLAGCAGQSNDTQDGSAKISEKRGIPDFERPEERPNISGIVKAVIGNEVTVLKIERQTGLMENNGENRDLEEAEGDKKDEERQQRPSSGFGGGMGMGTRSNTETRDTDERLAMLKSMSAGEEKIIIPVGIKMLKNEDGKMIEATLDDVVKDKMLLVWTDKGITERNIANFVIIN